MYTSPNCQRNKIFCCNFWTRRDTNTKLSIFRFYTVTFISVYSIVMVGRESLSTESRVQNPTKQRECYGMAIEISRLVADRADMWPASQTCAQDVRPQTLRQLQQALMQEWNNIPVNVIRWYLISMRRRCRAVSQSAGGGGVAGGGGGGTKGTELC